ncbi:MAG TPA: diacylglycerol kinase family lipid kinase [Anaerolineales bacterium]|nr:diacylglycerol kinase family lipid kinase [Anaerolineae bacterium]HIQ00861.1 diacylglycerol kinase family lipid kinase [Anaerolineales bacterium]
MPRVEGLIIYNPAAGPRDVKRELRRVRRELARRGWSVEIETTHRAGDATDLAWQAAREGLDGVWVAGGDGTVSEVVNGLVHSETALGVLPVGTGNVWARQLRLPVYMLTHPFRLREAAIAQAEGQVRSVDVGWLNDRYFLLWAGIGFDAQVTTELEPRDRRTKRLGPLPYAVAAITLAREFSGVRTHAVLDGRAVRGRTLLILVSNIQLYAFFPVARRARLDDGLLDVFIFKGLGLSYILRHAAKLFSGRHLGDPQIVQRQARQITVWTEKPVAVQADGDPGGMTPASLRVVPRALRIMVPPQAPPTLFSAEE